MQYEITFRTTIDTTVIIDAEDADDAGDAAYAVQTLKPSGYDDLHAILVGRDPWVDDRHVDTTITFVAPRVGP